MAKLTMSAALQVYRAAQADLGTDLGGFGLGDLLCDNFLEDSIADCYRVAAQILKDTAK